MLTTSQRKAVPFFAMSLVLLMGACGSVDWAVRTANLWVPVGLAVAGAGSAWVGKNTWEG